MYVVKAALAGIEGAKDFFITGLVGFVPHDRAIAITVPIIFTVVLCFDQGWPTPQGASASRTERHSRLSSDPIRRIVITS
ncbi:hypothetical protein DL991_31695 [Amycolatopsis sp. WAC 01375]|uniref:hypothetical protein n=1 Tax=unclassified Amycolatopsis TaxID=2618356 RepID=UPI000F76BD8B|nr:MULTISPECIES: hypothetical protein [unclassified Amycolatopsis]RSM73312.1 hypothetical protein DL991_31695 [Amycolatopsis sp. WAC 01375]RSN19911.1 hypothetical protein DL990_40815 [Amycolatopsis sp. WAC 01416]